MGAIHHTNTPYNPQHAVHPKTLGGNIGGICLRCRTPLLQQHTGAVFSAIYDAEKLHPALSTVGVLLYLATVNESRAYDIKEWFKESWRYLKFDAVLLNVAVHGGMSSHQAASKRGPVPRYTRPHHYIKPSPKL